MRSDNIALRVLSIALFSVLSRLISLQPEDRSPHAQVQL
jgi:hypothetical protein